MNHNRQIALDLFARLSAGDITAALDLMTDDVTWLIPGTPELSATAGLYDKERLRRLLERMLSQLEGGLQMSVVGSIAEGDRVAVEATSSGDLRNGRKYRQKYHFFIAFRDGKISAVREYLDTHHVYDVWARP